MPNNEPPIVSVIMPVFNTPIHLLKKSINSIIQQTYTSWELLISNDSSSNQDCINYIKEISQVHKNIYIFENIFKKGTAGARNTSIHYARGSYIAFLDSDDYWLPFYLKERIQHMEKNNYLFTCAWYEKRNEEGELVSKHKPKHNTITYKKLLTDCMVGCLTAIYNQKQLGKMFMPDLKKRQDFALWLQIIKKTPLYIYQKISAVYSLRKDSLSYNKFLLIKYNWKIYHEIEKLTRIKSAYYFSIFLFKYFIRKIKLL